MGAVGHCDINAESEGFFGLLNRERIFRMRYATLDSARANVFSLHRAVPQPKDAAKSCKTGIEVFNPFTAVRVLTRT